MKDHPNKLKESRLALFPDVTVESESGKLKGYISFSFKYFDYTQAQKYKVGQNFNDWTKDQLEKLCDKLKYYCNDTIEHWKNEPIGKGSGHVLEIYDSFPADSDFKRPKHVPLDVQWGRFRLESDMRLPGFILDKDVAAKHGINPNVFYIVFLDSYHQFYKSETK